jgi:hypothetical protein
MMWNGWHKSWMSILFFDLKGRFLMGRLVEVDDFVRQLWELYKDVRKEGIVQVPNTHLTFQ